MSKEIKELGNVLKNATEKERQKITKRLANILVDVVTANAYARAGEMMQKIYCIDSLEEDDTLTVTYDVGINGTVIRMLLAGIRRPRDIDPLLTK